MDIFHACDTLSLVLENSAKTQKNRHLIIACHFSRACLTCVGTLYVLVKTPEFVFNKKTAEHRSSLHSRGDSLPKDGSNKTSEP